MLGALAQSFLLILASFLVSSASQKTNGFHSGGDGCDNATTHGLNCTGMSSSCADVGLNVNWFFCHNSTRQNFAPGDDPSTPPITGDPASPPNDATTFPLTNAVPAATGGQCPTPTTTRTGVHCGNKVTKTFTRQITGTAAFEETETAVTLTLDSARLTSFLVGMANDGFKTMKPTGGFLTSKVVTATATAMVFS